MKVAAGGFKRLAASQERFTSKYQQCLFDRPAAASAKEVLRRKSHCSERATAVKGPPQRKTPKEVKISKAEKARKSESVWKAASSLKSTCHNQELSKYSRVSRCGLNARSCSGVNSIALIKFSWIWPTECAYMRGHICAEYSPSVHSVNGPVHSLRCGAGVYSANEPVQSLRVGLREWTGLSAEGHPP